MAGLVTLGLSIALGMTLADLTWQLVPRPELPAPDAVATPSAPSPSNPQAEDTGPTLDGVAQLALFGTFEPEPEPQAPPPQRVVEAPKTQLNLELQGIIAGSDPQTGLAIIAERRRDGSLYRVGDTITQGAVLHAVHRDRVILERGGQLETLELPQERGLITAAAPDETRSTARTGRSNATSGAPARAGRATQRNGSDRTRQRPPSGGARETTVQGPGRRSDSEGRDSAAVQELKQQVRANPTRFGQIARVRPARRDGSLIGYAIYPRGDEAIFQALGLEPGDIVTEVNGIALDSARGAMQLISRLRGVDQVQLRLLRDGVEMPLNIDLS
jgi:general secretion pathway protein C